MFTTRTQSLNMRARSSTKKKYKKLFKTKYSGALFTHHDQKNIRPNKNSWSGLAVFVPGPLLRNGILRNFSLFDIRICFFSLSLSLLCVYIMSRRIDFISTRDACTSSMQKENHIYTLSIMTTRRWRSWCIHAACVLNLKKSIYKLSTKLLARHRREIKIFLHCCCGCCLLKALLPSCRCIHTKTDGKEKPRVWKKNHITLRQGKDLCMEVNIIKSIALAIVVYLTRITQQHWTPPQLKTSPKHDAVHCNQPTQQKNTQNFPFPRFALPATQPQSLLRSRSPEIEKRWRRRSPYNMHY